MLRTIAINDFQNLSWDKVEAGWWRIVADLTCASCGAYQAADSDPTNDKTRTLELCARLFNSVGWRVYEIDRVLCPECAKRLASQDGDLR